MNEFNGEEPMEEEAKMTMVNMWKWRLKLPTHRLEMKILLVKQFPEKISF